MDADIAALDHTLPNFKLAYAQVLNAIHYDVDAARLKQELVAYARGLGLEAAAERAQANRINVEGSIALCLNRGAKLSPKSIERVRSWLEAHAEKPQETVPDWEELPETVKGKAVLAYVDCYSQIDNAKMRVLLGKMDRRELTAFVRKTINLRGFGKAAITKQVLQHYTELLTEAKRDDSVSNWVKPLSTIVDALSMLVGSRGAVKASAREAKARKMASTSTDRKGEKAASKVTYKDEDTALGITSVDPTNIVGADAVVVFNTKNRHCEIYFAKPGSKLSVLGARIINFDETRSKGKTLRKPDTDLPHWTRATTVKRLEVLLSSIRGKSWAPNGKLNHNTLIIKAL